MKISQLFPDPRVTEGGNEVNDSGEEIGGSSHLQLYYNSAIIKSI